MQTFTSADHDLNMSRSGHCPLFRVVFLGTRYISGKIFMKVRSFQRYGQNCGKCPTLRCLRIL